MIPAAGFFKSSSWPALAMGYLAVRYLKNLAMAVAGLWSVLYVFETVELLRRAGKRGGVDLGTVLTMGMMKLPETGLSVLFFAILFSAIFTFWQMTRRSELIVMRSAGLSVWQFIAPLVTVAAVVGVLTTTLFNPVSALMQERYRILEDRYLTGRSRDVALFDEGLWLRQQADGGGYVIVRAGRVSPADWSLQNVMALYFGADDSLIRRVDAPGAELQTGQWLFRDAAINEPGRRLRTVRQAKLSTNISPAEIEKSFAGPDTLSFWKIPSYARTLEMTGFDPVRLRVHFQSLLAQPFLFAAMILLAAAVSLRIPRRGGTAALAGLGVLAGFFTFFMSGFLQALGASHQIPVILAAWAPATVMLLLALTALLVLEDG